MIWFLLAIALIGAVAYWRCTRPADPLDAFREELKRERRDRG